MWYFCHTKNHQNRNMQRSPMYFCTLYDYSTNWAHPIFITNCIDKFPTESQHQCSQDASLCLRVIFDSTKSQLRPWSLQWWYTNSPPIRHDLIFTCNFRFEIPTIRIKRGGSRQAGATPLLDAQLIFVAHALDRVDQTKIYAQFVSRNMDHKIEHKSLSVWRSFAQNILL